MRPVGVPGNRPVAVALRSGTGERVRARCRDPIVTCALKGTVQ